MALLQPCSAGQHELLSELSGCLRCLLCRIRSVGSSSTCSKEQYSLVFSFAGIANGFMRHKPLLEHLSPGSCLSRDSDDRDCKNDYPTVEKLKSSMFLPLTITYFVVFVRTCHSPLLEQPLKLFQVTQNSYNRSFQLLPFLLQPHSFQQSTFGTTPVVPHVYGVFQLPRES